MTDEKKPAVTERPLDGLVRLPPAHNCPNCGYRITNAQFYAAAFDYQCPRCMMKILSQFRTVKQPNAEVSRT